MAGEVYIARQDTLEEVKRNTAKKFSSITLLNLVGVGTAGTWTPVLDIASGAGELAQAIVTGSTTSLAGKGLRITIDNTIVFHVILGTGASSSTVRAIGIIAFVLKGGSAVYDVASFPCINLAAPQINSPVCEVFNPLRFDSSLKIEVYGSVSAFTAQYILD